jgi:hypothetical protein
MYEMKDIFGEVVGFTCATNTGTYRLVKELYRQRPLLRL